MMTASVLLLRGPASGLAVPSVRTISLVLARQGFCSRVCGSVGGTPNVRFERPGPVQLWQNDIVGKV